MAKTNPFSKILRIGEGKLRKELERVVVQVNALEPETQVKTDKELVDSVDALRVRAKAGENLRDLEPEAYAIVREASQRVLGQRPFDVQIMGAAAMGRGMIAEMKTGEGKTLTATMTAFLNALSGKGVHIVTVNDYLAKRDSEWMGAILRFLGLTVGTIQSSMTPDERRPSYAADVTYGTNNEFGFDYLRDNMATKVEELVQRGHAFALVDEVDSILIDEARTPLIIAGSQASEEYWFKEFANIANKLKQDADYEIDLKKRQVITTEDGVHKVENLLNLDNLYDPANIEMVHHLDVALKAKTLFQLDVDYLIHNGEIMIVDEFTGRALEGRRYSEGLHQAIEAKEGVAVKEENQTLATVTLQNYFRMYDIIAGMTGTAMTEEGEFLEIYGLPVVEIPTNRDLVRVDNADLIYRDENAKYKAVVADIIDRNSKNQPVLVGTVSIEHSEHISKRLTEHGVKHEVLNAKQHTREAEIVAQAGRLGAVTVATNMAGRGVDIVLGGNPEGLTERSLKGSELDPASDEYAELQQTTLSKFKAAAVKEKEDVIATGGLCVIGTERHESRRIDNQLRGRSGRQGDPGESRFYLSTEDDLMIRFGGDRIASIMDRLSMEDDEAIENKMISKSVERAQTQVEEQNFGIRKHVLKYDEVVNKQREVVYRWRQELLQGNASDLIEVWIPEVANMLAENVCVDGFLPTDTLEEATQHIQQVVSIEESTLEPYLGADELELAIFLDGEIEDSFAQKAEEFGEFWNSVARSVALQVVDGRWQEHLGDLDYLRDGVGLRSIAQKDPLVEYQNDGFEMYSAMMETIKFDTLRFLGHVQRVTQDPLQAPPETAGRKRHTFTNKTDTSVSKTVTSTKIGRNTPCPCGSGKKYKRCHGAPGAAPLEV